MANLLTLDNGTVQNLKDAGCAEEFIESFAQIADEEKPKEQLEILSKHRSSLLDSIHEYQKKIDCLAI